MTHSPAALLDATSPILHLAHGLEFAELYTPEGLAKLDAAFLAQMGDAELKARLLHARAMPPDAKEESLLILALAPQVESFLAHLFGIEQAWEDSILAHKELDPLYAAKRLFVQRRAAKAYPAKEAVAFDGTALKAAVETAMGEPFSELDFAKYALALMEPKTSPLPEGRGTREAPGEGSANKLLASGEAHPLPNPLPSQGEGVDTALRFAAWAVRQRCVRQAQHPLRRAEKT